MSRRLPDYCVFCLSAWYERPVEQRRGTVPSRALTTVNRQRVCGSADCHDLALAVKTGGRAS